MGEVQIILAAGTVAAMCFLSGLKVVKPSERGVIESKGKIKKFSMPGTVFCFPLVQKLRTVNVAEQRIPIKYYHVTTKDGIDLEIDVDVYYQISDIPESVTAILYKIRNYKSKISETVKAELTEQFMQVKLKEISKDQLMMRTNVKHEITTSNYFAITKLDFKRIDPPEEVKESYLKKVKVEDEKQIAKKKVEIERQKAKDLEQIEIEKSKKLKAIKDLEIEEEKKRIQSVARTEEEEIKKLTEQWNEAYRKNEELLKRVTEEGRKRSVEKLRGKKK